VIRVYLYDQPLSDAVQMGFTKEEAFLDLPTTRRQALSDLVDGGGLKAGDVIAVSARSKLGKGQAASRIETKLAAMGVALQVIEVKPSTAKRRGKRRSITDAERTYCQAIWRSSQAPADAMQAIGNKLAFNVDWNWCQYHLGPRSGPTETEKEPDT